MVQGREPMKVSQSAFLGILSEKVSREQRTSAQLSSAWNHSDNSREQWNTNPKEGKSKHSGFRIQGRDLFGRLLLQVLQYSLSAGTDVEFLVDVSEVRTNGFDAEEKLVGNLFVMISLRQIGQDFHFPIRQVFSFF